MQKENLSAVVWQDKRQVSILSTLTAPNSSVTVKRKEKDGSQTALSCPTAINTYNTHMAGVDKGDQLGRYYSLCLKCMKNYKCMFTFVLDTTIINEYILYSNHICTLLYTYMHTVVHIHTLSYTHTYMCSVYMSVCMYMYVYNYVCLCIHVYVRVRVCGCNRVCVCYSMHLLSARVGMCIIGLAPPSPFAACENQAALSATVWSCPQGGSSE